MRRRAMPSARRRWTVASRVLAAAIGGYALTSLLTADLALLLPRVAGTLPAEGVLAATLWSFALYTAVVLWVFATRSATRAWTGLGVAGAVAGLAFAALKGWP